MRVQARTIAVVSAGVREALNIPVIVALAAAETQL
jgi:hypothetical protein